MADDRENQQEEDQRSRKGKMSRSIEETESSSNYNFSENERKQNLRWIESRRNEIDSRSWAQKKDNEGRIRDYGHSSNQQQQRQRDLEMQRRRYETKSRIWREERDNEGQIHDHRDSSNQQQQRLRDLEMQRRRYETESWREERERSPRRYDGRAPPNESEWRYDERSGRRYEPLESGGYRVHPGKNDCFSYFQTGTCFHGRIRCKFDHPTQLPQGIPEMTTNAPVCKYFLRGCCNKGSECGFPHTMNSEEGAKPMPQARPMHSRASGSEWKFDERTERRYETESAYRPEKRSRTIPDSQPRDLRGTNEIEQEKKKSPENRFMAIQRARERREAQGNVQEQGSIGRIRNLRDLINPIAEAFLEEMSKTENDRLSRDESSMRSSQQSNSKK